MDAEQRDRILLAEAKSAVGQCAHIIGADTTNVIMELLDHRNEAG